MSTEIWLILNHETSEACAATSYDEALAIVSDTKKQEQYYIMPITLYDSEKETA